MNRSATYKESLANHKWIYQIEPIIFDSVSLGKRMYTSVGNQGSNFWGRSCNVFRLFRRDASFIRLFDVCGMKYLMAQILVILVQTFVDLLRFTKVDPTKINK